MRTTLLTLTSLVLIILFSSLAIAQTIPNEEKELGSISVKNNKIINSIPKNLNINLDFEDDLFKGKKGYIGRSTGNQVAERPKIVDSIRLIEKEGIKFLEINSQDESYNIPPIPVVDGLNIKVSRQNLDGVRVKVDMPLAKKKNVLGKDKSGIMLVIPEEKLTTMLDQFKSSRTDIYRGFEEYQKTYKELYGKEKRYKAGNALRKVRSFDIVYLPNNKEILFIRMSRWLTGKKFNLDPVEESLKEENQKPREEEPLPEQPKRINEEKPIIQIERPVTKTEPTREKPITNLKEFTKRIFRKEPEQIKPEEIPIKKAPAQKIQPPMLGSSSQGKSEPVLEGDIIDEDDNQQTFREQQELQDQIIEIVRKSGISDTANPVINTDITGLTFSITPKQNTKLPTTDLAQINLIEKTENKPVTITLSSEQLKDSKEKEAFLKRIRSALEHLKGDYIQIKPIETGTFIPDKDKSNPAIIGSQKQELPEPPPPKSRTSEETNDDTMRYHIDSFKQTGKAFDFNGGLYSEEIFRIGTPIATLMRENGGVNYIEQGTNIFYFKAIVPKDGEVVFMPSGLYDSLLRETASEIGTGEKRVNYLGETSYSPDRTNKKLQEEFLKRIDKLKTKRGSGENEFYYVGYKELQSKS